MSWKGSWGRRAGPRAGNRYEAARVPSGFDQLDAHGGDLGALVVAAGHLHGEVVRGGGVRARQQSAGGEGRGEDAFVGPSCGQEVEGDVEGALGCGREGVLAVEEVGHPVVGEEEAVPGLAYLPVEVVACASGAGVADFQDVLSFVGDVGLAVELVGQGAEGCNEFLVSGVESGST